MCCDPQIMPRTESLSPARCQPQSHLPHINSDSMNNGTFTASNYPRFNERSVFGQRGLVVARTAVVFANLFQAHAKCMLEFPALMHTENEVKHFIRERFGLKQILPQKTANNQAVRLYNGAVMKWSSSANIKLASATTPLARRYQRCLHGNKRTKAHIDKSALRHLSSAFSGLYTSVAPERT